MTDETRLIDDALRGNSDAFGRLVCRYQDRLFTSLVHITGSHEEAEDVAQEAFVQAFIKLESFQGKSRFYTWLYRIALNISASRRRKRRGEIAVDFSGRAAEYVVHVGADSCDAPLERQELVAHVRAALSRLPQDHRQILVLRELEGCSYDDIVQILQLPAGTVRSRLHRARKLLHEILKEHQQKLL